MVDMWVCGICRSVNRMGAGRCYGCRTPRSTGESVDGSALADAGSDRTLAVLVAARRHGARVHETWPVAVLAGIGIAVSTLLTGLFRVEFAALVLPDGTATPDTAAIDGIVPLAALTTVAWLGATAAWSFWIALVLSNAPALTGRWPGSSPLRAFLAPLVPFRNLTRPMSVVREAAELLAPSPAGLVALITVWWFSFLAAYFVPTFLVYGLQLAGATPTALSAVQDSGWVQLWLLIPSAVLALAVLVGVERAQRARLAMTASIVPVEA
jgi:hypothetical protein